MLLRNDLEELKKSIDLLDYIVKNNSVCETHKYGNLVRINPCPICGKRDHFDVHIDTNSYFSQSGCCNGGSIIDYMIEDEDLNKIDAINKLKSLAGNYEEFKPKEIIEQNKVKYDFTPLIDSAANKVKDTNYFKDRGFSEETIKRHKLGYFNTGLNYAISKYPELFSEGKKTNDYFKGFKYFIPCFNRGGIVSFFINRYDDCIDVPSWVSNHTKVMNPKGSTPIPLNLKYLYQQFKEYEYIFLCEGWADALSCEEIGYKAIALNSTSNHRILTKYIDEIIDTDLLSNKIFIICGDNDSAGSILNNNLKEYFRSKNIPFEVFKLPNIKGVKDLNDLLVKDRDKFIEITSKFISKVKDKKDYSNKVITQYKSETEYKSLYKDLCKYIKNPLFREFENLKVIAAGLNSVKCEKSIPETQLNNIVNDIIDKYYLPDYIDAKGKIIPLNLAKEIVEKKKVISDRLNSYIYQDGYYCEVDSFYRDIVELIEDPSLITPKLVNDTSFHIFQSTNRGSVENDRRYINFKNGLWDIKNKKIISHTNEIITLGQFNGSYDGINKSIEGSRFEQYLNTSIEKDLIPVVQEMIGVCLYPLTDKIHYFYILVGEGRNGKGILMDIILNIVPSNFRSGITMKDYDTRFANASIKGKTLNICTDDKTTRLEGIGNLKSVTAGEGIFVERKGVDGVMIKTNLTHISSFNTLPSMQEKTNALFDRMIVIPFNNTFGDADEVRRGKKDMLKDPNLKRDIIDNELDIIISWAMEGLYRVIENKYRFTKPKMILDKLESYRSEVDSVRDWASKNLRAVRATSNKQYIKASILFQKYREWCIEEGAQEVKKKAFNESMYRMYKNYYKEIQKNNYYSVRFI